VYNARKRGEDRASDYFKRTENIAGVKDMRFQALMPDILHWLGIKKIDRMLSMSKYAARNLPPCFPNRLTVNAIQKHETRRHCQPRHSNPRESRAP